MAKGKRDIVFAWHNHKKNMKQKLSFSSLIWECDLGREMTGELKRESQYKEAPLSFPLLRDIMLDPREPPEKA